jgi:DNA invertase Pin-like site-specific DNA recombinase
MTRHALNSAAGYIRVSTEQQLDGFGLDIQRAAIEAEAEAQGLALGPVFADEGVSGGERLETREGLGAALTWLEEHRGGTLIIPRLDRLARDLMIQESVLADIWKAGGHVWSCSETERAYCQPDSPDDPARTLIRQVLGAVAAYERAMIKLRMVRGRRKLIAEQGWAGGQYPYGWADETEAAVLRHVAARRQQGYAFSWIANELNDHGLLRRSGKPWAIQDLHRTFQRANNRTPVEPEELALDSAV